ncbi:MAG TPA: membrane protein insertion efficiency factor YidD [Pseudonocardiaceae bacterium]|nr:membrane protein insertion efficiency factor YidD [Pseudonocardiaceae bacterium]
MTVTSPTPGTPGTRSARPVVRLLVAVLQFYRRWISPALPPSCRFYPSCSAYAVEALTGHGMLRGSWLTVRRLLRCAPWHPGGMDPVPPPRPPRGVSRTRARRTRAPQNQGPAESESSC